MKFNYKYIKYYFFVLLKNYLETKTSYSQHGEDLLVDRIIKPNRINTFLDIGANDGILFSNTYKFAKDGAKGICLEPSNLTFLKLRLNHLFNFRVKCLKLAISDRVGVMYLNESGYENVLSTITSYKNKGSYSIKTITLEKLLNDSCNPNSFDLVSIDVEGFEDKVLEGAGKSLHLCKIVIIEIDKIKIDDAINHPSLSNHYPAYSNGINLILLNSNFKFNNPSSLPEGFFRC